MDLTIIFVTCIYIFLVLFPVPETESKHAKVEDPKGMEEVSSELSYMKALDGFVLVLSQHGDIVYCSENIAEHLGVSQVSAFDHL